MNENLKIKVKNKKESRKIQKVLYELGCKWSTGSPIQYESMPYLYISVDKYITYSNSDMYYYI